MEGKSRESQETLSYRDQNTQIHVTPLMFSLKTIIKKKLKKNEEILVDVLLIETERGPLPHALQKSTVVCSTGQSRTRGILDATETTHLSAGRQATISDPSTKAPVLGELNKLC